MRGRNGGSLPDQRHLSGCWRQYSEPRATLSHIHLVISPKSCSSHPETSAGCLVLRRHLSRARKSTRRPYWQMQTQPSAFTPSLCLRTSSTFQNRGRRLLHLYRQTRTAPRRSWRLIFPLHLILSTISSSNNNSNSNSNIVSKRPPTHLNGNL